MESNNQRGYQEMKDATEIHKDKWNAKADSEKTKVKFLPKGKSIIIYPDHVPETQKIDGKFGVREMYILETSIGKVAFSPVQFIEINEALSMRGDYTKPMSYPL
jgi:hypothetical protein